MTTEYVDKYGGKRNCSRLTAEEWNDVMEDLDNDFSSGNSVNHIDTTGDSPTYSPIETIADSDNISWQEENNIWKATVDKASPNKVGGLKIMSYINEPSPLHGTYPIVLGALSYNPGYGFVLVPLADSMVNGLISMEDKSKLDSITGIMTSLDKEKVNMLPDDMLDIVITAGQINPGYANVTFTYNYKMSNPTQISQLISTGKVKCRMNISRLNISGYPKTFEGYLFKDENDHVRFILTEYSIMKQSLVYAQLSFTDDYTELTNIIIMGI